MVARSHYFSIYQDLLDMKSVHSVILTVELPFVGLPQFLDRTQPFQETNRPNEHRGTSLVGNVYSKEDLIKVLKIVEKPLKN